MIYALSRLTCRLFGHRWAGNVCTRDACRGREDATRPISPEALRRHDADMEAFIWEQYDAIRAAETAAYLRGWAEAGQEPLVIDWEDE